MMLHPIHPARVEDIARRIDAIRTITLELLTDEERAKLLFFWDIDRNERLARERPSFTFVRGGDE